jgi:hypothetical protein
MGRVPEAWSLDACKHDVSKVQTLLHHEGGESHMNPQPWDFSIDFYQCQSSSSHPEMWKFSPMDGSCHLSELTDNLACFNILQLFHTVEYWYESKCRFQLQKTSSYYYHTGPVLPKEVASFSNITYAMRTDFPDDSIGFYPDEVDLCFTSTVGNRRYRLSFKTLDFVSKTTPMGLFYQMSASKQ